MGPKFRLQTCSQNYPDNTKSAGINPEKPLTSGFSGLSYLASTTMTCFDLSLTKSDPRNLPTTKNKTENNSNSFLLIFYKGPQNEFYLGILITSY